MGSNVSPRHSADSPAGVGHRHRLIICSWNVEGLTDIKLEQIALYMKQNSLDVVCMQEVRKAKSDTFELDSGHLVFWSGGGGDAREWAGVGFMVSPRFKSQIIGYIPFSSRNACLKLKVTRGCIALFTVLATHNLRDLSEIMQFYGSSDGSMGEVSVNGGKNLVWRL